METLVAIAIVIVIAIAIVFLVAFYYLRKGIKFVKRMANGEMTEEDFERLSKKFHKAGGTTFKFDDDYFKGSGTKQQYQKPEESKKEQSHTFHTKEGVTIVDKRTPKSSKKIFAQDEGEYVEFTEEP